MKHVIEPVAQQSQAQPGRRAQRQGESQVAGHARRHGPRGKLRRREDAPGLGALGHLQPEALPRLDVRTEVVLRHLQLLLQGVVLLDLLGIDRKALGQLIELAPDLLLLG